MVQVGVGDENVVDASACRGEASSVEALTHGPGGQAGVDEDPQVAGADQAAVSAAAAGEYLSVHGG